LKLIKYNVTYWERTNKVSSNCDVDTEYIADIY